MPTSKVLVLFSLLLLLVEGVKIVLYTKQFGGWTPTTYPLIINALLGLFSAISNKQLITILAMLG